MLDGRMGCEEFGGRTLRGLNEVSGGSRTFEKSEGGWEERPSTEEAVQTSYYSQSGPHSRIPHRPALTGKWHIPVAWESQPAFKVHCVHVSLNAFACLWYLCFFCRAL